MADFTRIWTQLESLLNSGISIIPVRDKDDAKGKAKTPYVGWKKHQQQIITADELWKQMDRYDTSAIATICGAVSGNLEAIDIDVKYMAGIDAQLFALINDFYPDLFKRLRIHKTPSGGYHILYRCVEPIGEGNKKLAGRPATDKELAAKPDYKEYFYIETRGEGGYVVAPPSLDYTIHTPNEIPVITLAERNALIQLCRQLTQIIKQVKEKPVKGYTSDYYSTNPFEHFNNSPEGENVLLECGWKLDRETSRWAYYSKPNAKSPQDASFNKERRLFYFWSTNTQFETETWYNPSSVLAVMQYGGDKAALYKALVKRGYGKIKQEREQQLAQEAAMYGNPLPANISKEAYQAYEDALLATAEKYPHGIFWELADTDKYSINRVKLLAISGALGFRLHNGDPCCICGHIVEKVTERGYFDCLRDYILGECDDIRNCLEAFLQKSGTFTLESLPILDTALLHVQEQRRAYKYYKNCYIEITAADIVCHQYPTAGLIWQDQIQQRDFVREHDCIIGSMYYRYLHHAIGVSDYLRACIGYLAQDYKDTTMPYIIVLVERCADPQQGGGSGKNTFGNMLGNITSYHPVEGSQVQLNEKLLQSWNYQRIMAINDAPKKFEFLWLKGPSDGHTTIKKLFKDEVTISPEMSPKFIVSTNYSYEITDGGLRRRIRQIEFTDFFNSKRSIRQHFNANFPQGWADTDWCGYDNFMAECIQLFIAADGVIPETDLSEGGWEKQFRLEHGSETLDFIEENISNWCSQPYVSISSFNNMYNDFCNDNGIKYRKTAQGMNKAIAAYCKKHNIKFDPRVTTSAGKSKTFEGGSAAPAAAVDVDVPF